MTPSQKYLQKIGLKDPEPIENINADNKNDPDSYRDAVQKVMS